MKPLYLMINEIVTTLGAEKVAGRLGVSPSCVYRFGQPPEASGKDIPVKHLFNLIAQAASEETNKRLQQILDELLAFFAAPARRKVVREGAILELEEALKILKNGSTKEEKERVVHCPECFASMRVEGRTTNGLTIYRCLVCGGKGEEAIV